MMVPRASKTTALYEKILRRLQAGRFVPGTRIDPHELAEEFSTSLTPVLYALHRLVGEGMLSNHAREGGFQVPLTNELRLRNLYHWMQRLMVMACDIALASGSEPSDTLQPPGEDSDIVQLTRELFEEVAFATDDYCLYDAVRHTNNRLEPIRRVTQPLLLDASGEYAQLHRFWHKRDYAHLKAALVRYHERRMRLVPRIVGLLGDLEFRVRD